MLLSAARHRYSRRETTAADRLHHENSIALPAHNLCCDRATRRRSGPNADTIRSTRFGTDHPFRAERVGRNRAVTVLVSEAWCVGRDTDSKVDTSADGRGFAKAIADSEVARDAFSITRSEGCVSISGRARNGHAKGNGHTKGIEFTFAATRCRGVAGGNGRTEEHAGSIAAGGESLGRRDFRA